MASYVKGVDECSTDSDCAVKAACILSVPSSHPCGNFPDDEPPVYSRVCSPGCTTDEDCGAEQVCVCGNPLGHCVDAGGDAGCQSDADCAGDALCLLNKRTDSFGMWTFACQLPGDECASDVDCSQGESCTFTPDGRKCEPAPVCGRPFFVQDEIRVAPLVPGGAWSVGKRGDQAALPADPAVCRALAAHWAEIGLMEHASIAAFARFTLQLLSLGAPHELVTASGDAQLDETRHALLAFELASHFGGAPTGAGALPLADALADCSLEGILRLTFREGCVGETRAALEASRAAELCEDPILREVLETIARDESRHAELAWKTVHWILTNHPELRPVIEQELEAARCSAQELAASQGHGAEPEPVSPAERYGLLSKERLRRCQLRAYREVIFPCGRTLLAQGSARDAMAAGPAPARGAQGLAGSPSPDHPGRPVRSRVPLKVSSPIVTDKCPS